jgi:hypothetical protein
MANLVLKKTRRKIKYPKVSSAIGRKSVRFSEGGSDFSLPTRLKTKKTKLDFT